MSAGNGLRRLITEAAGEHNLAVKDLTVLATQNDPFRIDTPAGHRDGEWLEQCRRPIDSKAYRDVNGGDA